MQTITDKKLTVLVIILILICTNIYIIKKAKDKQNYKYYSIAILISIPIYLIFLLITYMTIFENILKNNNYTHIFIYRMDDEVKERIKSFFKYEYIQNDTLYKITTNENKICLEMER